MIIPPRPVVGREREDVAQTLLKWTSSPFFVLHTLEEHEKRTGIETAVRLRLSVVVHGIAVIVIQICVHDKKMSTYGKNMAINTFLVLPSHHNL